MSVEILDFSKQGNKTLHLHSDEAHWARRKAAIRAKRESSLQYTLHRPRRRRHTLNETATHVTATPAADDATRPEATRSDAARHDATRRPPAAPSRVSAEWSGATGGPLTQVVLRLHPAPSATPQLNVSSLANAAGGSGVVVRAEEALIVAFVLLLWVAAIALFFNRWGKIRHANSPYSIERRSPEGTCLTTAAPPSLPTSPAATSRTDRVRTQCSLEASAEWRSYQRVPLADPDQLLTCQL
ncbi:hypothetical protein JYU34_005971 [Plutella xylostella]|uniref:Fibronectin type III domain-containing protein n=1 Tax=Plutella xylostella TaxID=51655 RepID=A0ABQ7QUL3_PLUXY|nr:hypothetical protein JYU34_005971 [Plutella xylostella]